MRTVTLKRVVDALRTHGDDPPVHADGPTRDRLIQVLREAEADSAKRLEQITLRDLATER